MKKLLILFMLLVLPMVYGQTYNTTALDNSNNLYEFTVNLNTVTDNSIGLAILLIVTVIAFTVGMASDGNPYSGMAASAFFSGVSATILLPLLLINFETYRTIIVLDALALGIIFLFGGRK